MKFSQEFRFATKLDGPVNGIFGLNYWEENVENDSVSITAESSGSHCFWSSVTGDLNPVDAENGCTGYTEAVVGPYQHAATPFRDPNPSDRDTGWEIELAIPWKVLAECANRAAPPSEGDVWRINFSRVEWKTIIEGGRYVKATDPETGKPYAERNWTWSPQGIVNMHYPEMWGYVLFTNVVRAMGGGPFEPGPDEEAWDALRELYYAEKTWFLRYGEYTADFGALGLKSRDIFNHEWPPVLEATKNRFEARLNTPDGSGTKQITEDGRTRIIE